MVRGEKIMLLWRGAKSKCSNKWRRRGGGSIFIAKVSAREGEGKGRKDKNANEMS